MSKLIKTDSATETSYKMDGFIAATDTEKFSYTSARVTKPVYNQYKGKNKPKVIGYYTDWSQYDARIDTPTAEKSQRGRGYDLTNISPTAYDKIILGFLGIVGNAAEQNAEADNKHKGQTIQVAAGQVGATLFEPIFLDTWGDFQSYRNCGFTESGWNLDPATVTQETTKGIVGGLRDLQKKAKDLGHNLVLSMSIGGWTMSNLFHDMSRDQSSRERFALGLCKLFQQFPMFSEVDIDWEYPAANGFDNPQGPEDGKNYALLIAEVIRQLAKINRSDVRVSIASSAVIKTFEGSNVKELLKAGLYGINVMTYDFFGVPWAETLTHHTNLNALAQGGLGIDTIVDYLISEGFPSERINIGYAAYSRNAPSVKIDSFSPLSGSYQCKTISDWQGMQVVPTTGTFESGCTEWYDLIYNYLDLEGRKGRNGFNVYTDMVANADYLYNPDSKLFMSIETPRSVREKGRYAAERELGGLFTWTIDQDNGVLVNAAREGLGYEVANEIIEMDPLYFYGINIDDNGDDEDNGDNGGDDEGNGDENGDSENRPPVAVINMGVIAESRIQLSGSGSADEEDQVLKFHWNIPNGINVENENAEIIIFSAPVVSEMTKYPFTLTVEDSQGAQSTSDTFILTVYPAQDPIPDPTIPEWNSNTIYGADPKNFEKVSWKGAIYQAKWWTKGDRPDLNSGINDVWRLLESK